MGLLADPEARERAGRRLGELVARSRHRTPYGMAESSWRLEPGAGSIEVTAVVPPSCDAVVVLPGRDTQPVEVGPGTHRWSYEPEGLDAWWGNDDQDQA